MTGQTTSPLIVTADGVEVHEGDRVFSHYTCTWGVIQNAKGWATPDTPLRPNEDIWFDFVQDDGKVDLLNGERIASKKPAWMN